MGGHHFGRIKKFPVFNFAYIVPMIFPGLQNGVKEGSSVTWRWASESAPPRILAPRRLCSRNQMKSSESL